MKNAAIIGALGVTLSLLNGASAQDAQQPPRISEPPAIETQAADDEAKANIIVLYANNSGKGIDKRIGKMPQLEQPPFSSYDTYELVKRAELPFSIQSSGKLALPNDTNFEIQLNSPRKSQRYDVKVSIVKPSGKKFLSADVKAKKEEIFFIAGPKYKKGILVLGIKVLPK